MSRKPVTLKDIQQAKDEGRKVVMMTAYDYPMSEMGDAAGIDMLLVGDSLGMVVLGLSSTVPVTMADMIHHTKAVRRGCQYAHVCTDLPFLSYHASIREGVYNAGMLMKEGGADSVKLEGGVDFAHTIEAIVKAGIPVCGHIGLTPQTTSALSGFKAQGRDEAGARKILEDALAVEAAGAFAVVVEAVPHELGKMITSHLRIPVIGIGAGPHTDGQVLVVNDMLGMFDRFVPKFVKKFANLRPQIVEAMTQYKNEVQAGTFPAQEHCFNLSKEAKQALEDLL